MLNFKNILSDNELKLIKVLSEINGKKYKYIARDTDGIIRLYEEKPRINKSGNLCGEYTYANIGSWDRVLFSNITHKDGVYDIENKCFIKEEEN